MGRYGSKAKSLARAIPPDALAEMTEETVKGVFGRGPVASALARLLATSVFIKAGGVNRRMNSKRPKSPHLPNTKPIQVADGVEYYPPEKK